MLNQLQTPFSLLGRLLLALLFLPAGIGKLSNFAGTVGYISSGNLPFPTVAAVVAIVLEVGGGLALVLGYKTRWTALALALFTLVATLSFHAFWAVPEAQAMMQKLMFFKNIAVIGGLLTLSAWGAGAWSVDARTAR